MSNDLVGSIAVGSGRSSWPESAMADQGAQLGAIAAAVRVARKARRWSQTELASRAGVSRPTIARLESASSVSSATLMKVASALNLRLTLDQ